VRIFVAAVVALTALASCGSKSKDLLVRPFDAGTDASAAVDGGGSQDASGDADTTLGGPCVDDPQCDDAIACTFDRCDLPIGRCRNVPDDTQCDDGLFCDGREVCVRGHGCERGPVVTCEDGNACAIHRCAEASKSCEQSPRDLDGDGDPDDHCAPKHDCDDLDPNVSSLHSEICANHKDDNCNGVIDEAACATPAGDTCAAAIAVNAAGTYVVSSVGANKDYGTSCSVTTPSAAHDIVVALTIPAGTRKDLDIWATTPGPELAIAVEGSCGQASSELACGSGSGASSVRARARALAPGTYFAIVTTQAETSVELAIAFLDPTPKPSNESCANAAPIAPETATTVSIIDPAKDLVSSCGAATGELTYALTLAQPADVRVFASTLRGSGVVTVGLRAPHCSDPADELRCREGGALPLFARNLAAGTYVITVAATAPIDANILVKTAPPTIAPLDQTCALSPPLTAGTLTDVDLSNHEDAIKDGCFAGGPTAAYALTLPVASDVLLVGRFPHNEPGAVSFDLPACGIADRLACTAGSTPVRVSKRNVAAGDYRVVVTDRLGEHDNVTAFVRDAVPPTPVTGADTCGAAFDIPAAGGFFTGDTTNAMADIDEGCDASNGPPGGAPDQVLRLVLTQPRRVVLDMQGSTYTTILDVRQGPSCPGPEVSNACYVGFGPERSFLDLTYAAGTYWIVIDGYAGARGAWNLDVRVLPP
jgi:hypothetical protein